MATQYSNKPIVTDGLVYALDFGNPKGYANVTFSGSSTTVNPGSVLSNLKYDTSYVATLLTASATISPLPKIENGLLKMETSGSNGGSHIEIILGSTSITTFPFLQPDSWNGTITFVAEGKSGIIFSQLGNDYAGSLSGRLNSTLTPTQYAFGSGFGPVARSYNADYTGLNHFTLRMSSGSLDFFLNGIPISASGLSVSNDTSNGSRTFRIGTRVRTGVYGGMFTGSIGTMYLYNRPLTKDEIYQNYTVMSRRYDLPENEKIEIDENAYLFLQSAGITDPIITGSIDTFVRGLKQNNLWDKMIAIYPFVGTGSDGVNLTGSQSWNLKEPSLVTYPLSFTGSWNGSVSGSTPSGSNTNITVGGITPSQYYPFFNTQSAHISILSYDTPVSNSYLMGTGMTEDLAISTLAGDYGTPAAAYSVRKVRTAYSGALMDVRRDSDNTTGSFGFDAFGNLDTGSLLAFVTGSDGTGSGFVARWYDQSGNNRHATQTATGSQPVIVESGSVVSSGTRPSLYWKTDGLDNLQFSQINNIQTVFHISQLVETGSNQSFILGDTGIFEYHAGANSPQTWLNSESTLLQIRSGSNFVNGTSYDFTTKNRDLNRNLLTLIHTAAVGTANQLTQDRALGLSRSWRGYIQEITLYTSSQATNREPIEYNINNYYNIYPQTSSFTTSSFTIYATSGSVSASLNNRLTSGIPSSGPLGLITVSRTGSNSLTIARNGATTSFAVPASGALSTGIYLGAINNNGLALGNSPLGISFASVGTGLTNSEVQTLNRLVYQANYYRDPDALLFLQATQITNSTQVLAVQNLVADLKGYGIWDKMKAVYPMVSDGINQTRAFQHKFNLKDPRDLDAAYRLTFTGGWVHSSTGALPNGSTGTANTYYITSTPFEGLSYYNRTNSNTLGIDIGVFSNFHLLLGLGSTSARARNMTLGNIDYNYGSTNVGFWQTNRLTTGSNGYNFNYNGNVTGQDSSYTAGNYGPVYISEIGYPSNRECAFASVHIGLTNTEAANFYTAVQRFQTTLGRQV